MANYSVLKLTEKSRPLLRGEIHLNLAKPRIKAPSEPKSTKAEGRKLPNQKPLILSMTAVYLKDCENFVKPLLMLPEFPPISSSTM